MTDYEFTDLAEPPLAFASLYDEQLDTLILEQAAGTLSAWLSTHCSPHAMMVITTDSIEVFEGQRRLSISHPAMPDPMMPDPMMPDPMMPDPMMPDPMMPDHLG